MGYLYKRRQRDGTLGGPFWVKFYSSGRCIQESTGTTKEQDARRFLKEREGRVAIGAPILRRADKIRYEELAQDLRTHYETTGARGLREADTRFKPLLRFFAGRRIVSVDGPLMQQYVTLRQQDGVSNGTVNRELATVIRMLRLGYENGKVQRLPVIRKLKEAAPRQGFFEPDQFAQVRRQLRPDLQVAVTIAYSLGWRMQSEVLTLTPAQVDLDEGALRLHAGTTKNGDGREVYLTPELRTMLVAQLDRVKLLSRRLHRVVPYLFPHLSGPHEGTRVKNFRRAWTTACKKSGLIGMLRHDFRRSAVRNLVRAGVSEHVAMTITGHKTRAVFERYNIVSPGDLRAAAHLIANPVGTTTGTTDEHALTRNA